MLRKASLPVGFLVFILSAVTFPDRGEASVACSAPDLLVKGGLAAVGALAGTPAYFGEESQLAWSGGLSHLQVPETSRSRSLAISMTGEARGMWGGSGYEAFWTHLHATPSDCENLSAGALALGLVHRLLDSGRHRISASVGAQVSGTEELGAGPYFGIAYTAAAGTVRFAPRLRYLPTPHPTADGLNPSHTARADLRIQYRSHRGIEPFVAGVFGSQKRLFGKPSHTGAELGIEARW